MGFPLAPTMMHTAATASLRLSFLCVAHASFSLMPASRTTDILHCLVLRIPQQPQTYSFPASHSQPVTVMISYLPLVFNVCPVRDFMLGSIL